MTDLEKIDLEIEKQEEVVARAEKLTENKMHFGQGPWKESQWRTPSNMTLSSQQASWRWQHESGWFSCQPQERVVWPPRLVKMQVI